MTDDAGFGSVSISGDGLCVSSRTKHIPFKFRAIKKIDGWTALVLVTVTVRRFSSGDALLKVFLQLTFDGRSRLDGVFASNSKQRSVKEIF